MKFGLSNLFIFNKVIHYHETKLLFMPKFNSRKNSLQEIVRNNSTTKTHCKLKNSNNKTMISFTKNLKLSD